MTWEKKKMLVTVKAYPETSKKYGTVVCTAGITEDGEWLRLYPVPFNQFIGRNKIAKYDWIEVECKRATDEKLRRKESYKVRDGTIKVIDSSYRTGRDKWEKRNRILFRHISPSLEHLQNRFAEDRTSLGMIKPVELLDFYKTAELKNYESGIGFQLTLSGGKVPILTNLPHIFKYRFTCGGCEGGEHNIQCEDWELLESYRKWWEKYKTPEELWEKIHQRFFIWMKERDLYFYVGTYSQYPTWLIIGLYYPPVSEEKKPLSLKNFIKDYKDYY